MDNLLRVDVPQSLGNPLKLRKKELNENHTSELNAFIHGKKDDKINIPYSLKDYSELAEKAGKGLEVPSDDEDLMVSAAELNAYLSSIIPINSSITLYGVDEREPSDFEKMKFIRQLRVIENPAHVLDLMYAGMLSPLEVDTLAEVYPQYYDKLTQDILDEISNYAGQADKLPSPDVTRNLSLLLRVPRLTPSILENRGESVDEPGSPADMKAQVEAATTDVQQVLKG